MAQAAGVEHATPDAANEASDRPRCATSRPCAATNANASSRLRFASAATAAINAWLLGTWASPPTCPSNVDLVRNSVRQCAPQDLARTASASPRNCGALCIATKPETKRNRQRHAKIWGIAPDCKHKRQTDQRRNSRPDTHTVRDRTRTSDTHTLTYKHTRIQAHASVLRLSDSDMQTYMYTHTHTQKPRYHGHWPATSSHRITDHGAHGHGAPHRFEMTRFSSTL